MATTAPVQITDITESPTYGDGFLSRWCKRALYEPRDEVFVRLTLKVIAIMSVAMGGLWAALHWPGLPAWSHLVAAGVYITVWAWYSAPVILMLHCTMHRPFIRRPKVLDRMHPYAMSFYFGIPTGYAEHHLGMHHVEDNMPEDLSSTMRYRRDSFLNFLVYFGRFFFFILIELTLYFVRKRRMLMAKRAVVGELCHQSLIVASLLLDWRFGLVAFAIPYCAVRFLMMVGNWGQHAFVNTGRKNDGLSNSITCINSGYNRRAFNDGYHIGHHLKATRHWTELPTEFRDNIDRYAREGAIVFEKIDFFLVSILLWTGQWKTLAKLYVRLDGKPKSDEEVIALLKSRVQPIPQGAGFNQAASAAK
ncbi:MAG: fatty acid desaturase [Polyangiaceae bacterium]|nr:fatty acid desaturase [Polyangiaceae bacterium]